MESKIKVLERKKEKGKKKQIDEEYTKEYRKRLCTG
jgi:hypothetical protein